MMHEALSLHKSLCQSANSDFSFKWQTEDLRFTQIGPLDSIIEMHSSTTVVISLLKQIIGVTTECISLFMLSGACFRLISVIEKKNVIQEWRTEEDIIVRWVMCMLGYAVQGGVLSLS